MIEPLRELIDMPDDLMRHEPDLVLNGNETVLVVDDFESVRTLLNAALTSFGYSVICARDGADGLEKFRNNKDEIRLMLLDIVMPKLNGIELFREVSKLQPNTKVLFMTGYNDLLDMSGFRDKIKCISKPFKIKTLLREMRSVLDN